MLLHSTSVNEFLKDTTIMNEENPINFLTRFKIWEQYQPKNDNKKHTKSISSIISDALTNNAYHFCIDYIGSTKTGLYSRELSFTCENNKNKLKTSPETFNNFIEKVSNDFFNDTYTKDFLSFGANSGIPPITPQVKPEVSEVFFADAYVFGKNYSKVDHTCTTDNISKFINRLSNIGIVTSTESIDNIRKLIIQNYDELGFIKEFIEKFNKCYQDSSEKNLKELSTFVIEQVKSASENHTIKFFPKLSYLLVFANYIVTQNNLSFKVTDKILSFLTTSYLDYAHIKYEKNTDKAWEKDYINTHLTGLTLPSCLAEAEHEFSEENTLSTSSYTKSDQSLSQPSTQSNWSKFKHFLTRLGQFCRKAIMCLLLLPITCLGLNEVDASNYPQDDPPYLQEINDKAEEEKGSKKEENKNNIITDSALSLSAKLPKNPFSTLSHNSLSFFNARKLDKKKEVKDEFPYIHNHYFKK
ncbi:MAG: hypothetical protein LEGION0398_MBIBDBAK_00406 [Legionellaceae bacterium]